MNLVQLRSFVTVAHLESFTLAAGRLHLSQPAISGHIRALEAWFGSPLFRRGHRSVRLSEEGRALLVHAERVIAETDRLLKAAPTIARRESRPLRVGFVVGTETVRMEELLALTAGRMPRTRVDVAQGLSGWIAERVRAGYLDGGFFLGPTPPAGLVANELTRLTYVLCTPPELAERARGAGPHELAELPWVWAPEGASYPRIVRELFSPHGVTPRQAIEADREGTIADLVIAGIGVAVLREPFARRIAAEGRVAIIESVRAEVPMFFLTSISPDEGARRLQECVLATFGTVR